MQKHGNVKRLYSLNDLNNNNKHNYLILNSNEDFYSSSTKLILQCKKHGNFNQSVFHFLNGTQCQKCYSLNRKSRVSFECWVDKCNLIHEKDHYIYKKKYFKSVSNDVNIICTYHGNFIQSASVHQRGHGCPKCAIEKNSKNLKLTNESFIEKSNVKHDKKYNYTKTKYVDCRSKVIITCKKHGDFEQVSYYHLVGNGCPLCGVEKTTFKSKGEYEIIDFLKKNNITNILHSNRSLGFEIDILLPDFGIGIEFNGLYWHSSNSIITDKKYSNQHVYKTNECEKNNIQLLHIFDNEWNDSIKQAIWKSMILNKLNKTFNRIYARNCQIRLIKSIDAKLFFNHNHLQGHAKASIYYGLFFEDNLMSVASFGKARFEQTKSKYELIRFATKINTIISGGFSKLITEFKKQLNNKQQIISFANRRWSSGNVYNINKFSKLNTSIPCYYYTDGVDLWHRSLFQKHLLSKKLKLYNSNLTEVKNMYNNGYRRIWDSGHIKYGL